MQIQAVSSVSSFPNNAFKVHRKHSPVLAQNIFVTTVMLKSASHNKASIKLIKTNGKYLNQ